MQPLSVWPPSGATFALEVDRRSLSRVLTSRSLSPRAHASSHVRRLDSVGGRLDVLHSAIAQLVAAAGGRPSHSTRLQHGPDETLSHVPQVAATRLANLEAWIDSHRHEPITLGVLYEVAGVAARTLQRAFEQRRGMSPMRFVSERRLAAAHRALRIGSPTRSVTQVATATGFSHRGRFTSMYRQTYGQTPPETLRCALTQFG